MSKFIDNLSPEERIELVSMELFHNPELYREIVAQAYPEIVRDLQLPQFYRKGMETHILGEEIERKRRYGGGPLTFSYTDLVGLKKVNDKYTQEIGDCLIEAFVHAILKESRPTDKKFRMGGDEFAILFPETSKYEAKVFFERLARNKGMYISEYLKNLAQQRRELHLGPEEISDLSQRRIRAGIYEAEEYLFEIERHPEEAARIIRNNASKALAVAKKTGNDIALYSYDVEKYQ